MLSALVQFYQIIKLDIVHIMMEQMRKGGEENGGRGVDDCSDQMIEVGNVEASG